MVYDEKPTGGNSTLTARNMCERVVPVESPRKHPRALPSSNGHLSPALITPCNQLNFFIKEFMVQVITVGQLISSRPFSKYEVDPERLR
jgi:hypothetical protein